MAVKLPPLTKTVGPCTVFEGTPIDCGAVADAVEKAWNAMEPVNLALSEKSLAESGTTPAPNRIDEIDEPGSRDAGAVSGGRFPSALANGYGEERTPAPTREPLRSAHTPQATRPR